MTKIFVTGVTGYIGGDAFHVVYTKYPDYEYTVLGRSEEKLKAVTAKYPNVKTVLGTLEDAEILTKAASEADIVLQCANSDNVVATNAIIDGLSKRAAEGKPAFLIHTSGTGLLLHANFIPGRENTVFDDYEGVDQIINVPDNAFHKNVESLVQASGDKAVKSAIVAPATIYGTGRGTGNTKSIQVPWLAEHTLKRGHGIQVGDGKAGWNYIHIRDLSNIYLRLVEEAVKGGGSATWGKEAYYIGAPSSERLIWGEVAKQIADYALEKGYIASNEVKSITIDEANAIAFPAGWLWGLSSNGNPVRARKVLGWEPVEVSFEETIQEAVDVEAEQLGKK